MLTRFLRYYFNADTIYNIHSPFLFEFAEENFDLNKSFYAYDEIEYLRTQLSKIEATVVHQDFGAGSKKMKSNTIKIKDIAKHSASSFSQGKILFNIVKNKQPATILELGTSLGLSSLYMAKASRKSQVYTLEGSPAIAKLAKANFKNLRAENIKLIKGQFSETLDPTLNEIQQVDLAFIDGDHQYKSTLKYFEQIKPYCHTDSIIIFDDIHWSAGMQKAWREVIEKPEIGYSIDLFYFGIVFFNQNAEEKQNLRYIPFKYKPFKIGLFT